MITKTLVISDIHLETREEVDPSYMTIKNMIAKERFDRIIILGDYFDFSYISRFNEDLPGLLEGKRLKDDFSLMESELRWMKKYCKDITYVEGNHEIRVQTLIYKNPVLEGIISIDKICKDIGIPYIATHSQPFAIFKNLYGAHGLALTKYCAASNIEKSGVSIITGHSHRSQVYITSQLSGSPMVGISIGCISSLSPNYVKGKCISGWSQSFAIISSEGDLWDIQMHTLKGHKCIVNNKIYSPFLTKEKV